MSESRRQQLREGLIAVHSQLRKVTKLTQVGAFEPSSTPYRGWWIFTTLCALATSIFTPWEVAFTAEAGLSPYDDVPAIVEYFLTSVFVLDIMVHLNLAFVNKEGKMESGKKAIAKRYLRCMFWIDLIGVIPFSTLLKVCVHFDEDKRSFALLRLARLVRARRLWALFRDFEINTRFHQIATTLIRNLTIVFLVAHCAACAFYYIAREYGFDQDTWIGANLELISDPDHDDREDISREKWKKYVYCFYWSITTMTTVGYGDYTPKNMAEVVFATIYMLFNIALNAYILGTITLVVIRTDETTALQRKGYEELEKFANLNELSPRLVTTLRNHLRYNYMNQAVKESELMNNLPSNIRRKVLNDLYGERLHKFPIFKRCSPQFIAALLEFDSSKQSFDVEKYLPDDEIVTKGDVAHALHFLLDGQVSTEDDILQDLTVFPLEPFKKENASQRIHLVSETLKAVGTCDVLRIPHESLFSALDLFEEDRTVFYQFIEEHFRGITPMSAELTLNSQNGQMQDSTEPVSQMALSEDVGRIRRLLRNAFSELVSLSERVLSLEEKTETTQFQQKRNCEIDGTIELNSGLLLRRGEELDSSLLDGPLLHTKAKIQLPLPGSDLELTGTSSKKEFHLQKLLLRCAWLSDVVKFVFCPFGGNGFDVIPTLNPNADDGVSRMTRHGCPVHHELKDSSCFGGSVHHGGQMFGTGVFHSNPGLTHEQVNYFNQGIISPTANLTFGIFASHAFERVSRFSQGSSSSSVPRLPRLELMAVGRSDAPLSGLGSGRWQMKDIKFGTVSAWNFDDEFILSGWLALKTPSHKLQTTELESFGVAISTFPYANLATQKLALEISPHPLGGKKYSLECGAKHRLDNGVELHPSYIMDFSKHGLSTWLGIKTLLKL